MLIPYYYHLLQLCKNKDNISQQERRKKNGKKTLAKQNQRYSKRGNGWETCKNWIDPSSLKGHDVSLRQVYKT